MVSQRCINPTMVDLFLPPCTKWYTIAIIQYTMVTMVHHGAQWCCIVEPWCTMVTHRCKNSQTVAIFSCDAFVKFDVVSAKKQRCSWCQRLFFLGLIIATISSRACRNQLLQRYNMSRMLLLDWCSTCSPATITQALYQSHWLPVSFRIQFKLCLLMHHIHTRRSPAYMADTVKLVSDNSSRPGLRSAVNVSVH